MEFLWVCLNSVHRGSFKKRVLPLEGEAAAVGQSASPAQQAPLSLFREGVVERLNGFRKVLLRDADYDVDFARALRDHADIDVGFGQGAEELRGRSHAGIHIAADNGNQCDRFGHTDRIGRNGLFDFRKDFVKVVFNILFVDNDIEGINAARQMLN